MKLLRRPICTGAAVCDRRQHSSRFKGSTATGRFRGSTATSRRYNSAFVLLEVMLGVAIFAMGVLALGKCVNNCVIAEVAKNEDRKARLALSNRLAEIEGGAVDITKAKEEPLKGMFQGITIKQQVKPVPLKNERKQVISGIYEIDLEAVWKSGNETQSKELSVYVQRS